MPFWLLAMVRGERSERQRREIVVIVWNIYYYYLVASLKWLYPQLHELLEYSCFRRFATGVAVQGSWRPWANQSSLFGLRCRNPIILGCFLLGLSMRIVARTVAFCTWICNPFYTNCTWGLVSFLEGSAKILYAEYLIGFTFWWLGLISPLGLKASNFFLSAPWISIFLNGSAG